MLPSSNWCPPSTNPMLTDVSASYVTPVRSRHRAQPKESLLVAGFRGLRQLGALSIPILAFFLVRKLRKKGKTAAAAAATAAGKAAGPATTPPARSKPRREYKVKRDRAELTAEIAEARQQQWRQQQELAALGGFMSGDQAEQGEGAQEAAGAGAGGDEQQQFFKMLQQMGFKMVAPKDGSNQVFLVPPGQDGEGGEAGDKADEDEDPDAEDEEEGDEEEDEEEEEEEEN